ncbi:recombinase family protein [Rufibacter sp. LB8]|uniref:recombinase family protein n=1 Tax=Rufibacter sp. LB8 TaxID=2777781 RepID=UPI00178C248F|nr:recombinase family protein [Rufibacter sp. LB8]
MRDLKDIVVYYRVSTKRQGESGLGLEAQRTYVKHFYSQEPIKEFVETVSGKEITNRPMLLEAIKLCKQRNATLVVAKVDRLSRTTEQALQIYAELEERLESCDMPNLDKFSLTLFMAIADRERQLISLRTKAALDEKRKIHGEWRKPSEAFRSGKASPAGIVAIKGKAKSNLNNRKAQALVKSLRDFQNLTWREIADELNKGAFKTSKGGTFQATQAMRLYKSAQ